MSLFELITDVAQKQPAILLIDSSGSTKESFDKVANQVVFDKFEEIVKNIPNDFFRVIFWNTPTITRGNFKYGIFSMPHIVKKTALHQLFEIAKVDVSNQCLTFPHIGFDAIPNDWINNINSTHIYFLTDGEITTNAHGIDSKNSLKSSIVKLFKTHNNIHLHLITVEPRIIDLNNVETLNSIAGGDVFKVFKENNLTKHITEFKSFTLNNKDGYKHIDVIIPPEGFIPYEQNYFSESNTAEFIQYISGLVESKKDDEEYLIKVIQNLTITIRYLIKDKLPTLSSNIIRTFCNIFENTVIDKTIAEFMLRDTTQQETNSIVYSEYRKRVKEYFKQAEEFLSKDVKVATGIRNNFITLPIDDIIVTGNANAVNYTWNAFKKQYPNSCITVNGNIKIPVLPFENTRLTDINEQCIRQYVRAMISAIYNINAMDDYVIYIVLVLVLRTILSDIPENVKQSMRMIGIIMMKKKRLNTVDTELEYFSKGHVPAPNDCKPESFVKIMGAIKTLFNIDCQTHTLWYALCLALNNEELALRQLIHCNADILIDFPQIINAKTQLLGLIRNKFTPINHVNFIQSCLDYTCIYTGKDTSGLGGYVIREHNQCIPQYVISTDGYAKIRNNLTIFCPDCYTKIGINHFEQVGAKINEVLDVSTANITNKCFSSNKNTTVVAPMNNNNRNTVIAPPTTVFVTPQTISTSPTNNYIIFMKGTVGSGKTTFSESLQQKLAIEGWNCFVTGVDKFCISGYTSQEAVQQVKNEISLIKNYKNKTVLIIDTCGENINAKNTFGYDLSSWKTIVVTPNFNKQLLTEYLSWSLNNVLKRERYNSLSNYYLNKFSASEQICYDVHYKKASNLFGKKNVTKLTCVNYGDVERYQKFLDDNDFMNVEVNRIVKQIVG